jgi:hypothetical protein
VRLVLDVTQDHNTGNLWYLLGNRERYMARNAVRVCALRLRWCLDSSDSQRHEEGVVGRNTEQQVVRSGVVTRATGAPIEQIGSSNQRVGAERGGRSDV